MVSMPKVSPQTLRQLANQLQAATRDENWQAVKQLDLQLRPILLAYRTIPHSSVLEAELAKLKQGHQLAYSALSTARDKVKQHIDSAPEQKERILAYQLAMDME
ncbi:hypothetical protein BIT28_02015 [Photobacterium proteolyticum]|uniref:LafD n=2 Tax=Photobacterium proteolyticum TaxID=1903952 RepID=A0A1Q9GVE4_9GAMM|nr:hypothetical protein BIT28_02015 [Photobacterium proteolyticum]